MRVLDSSPLKRACKGLLSKVLVPCWGAHFVVLLDQLTAENGF